MTPKDRLIPALDLPTADEVLRLAGRLVGVVTTVKIGLRSFVKDGPALVRQVRALDLKVFLDLKLHDIPSTVEATARAAAELDVEMLTVHASGGPAMVSAAVEGAAGRTKILAVTVLTSMSEKIHNLVFGSERKAADRVLDLATMSCDSKASGVVCSPLEAGVLRKTLPPDRLIVTPGIRPAGVSADDQSRAATVAEAIRAGATHLVVGRPILEAIDPAAAAMGMIREIEEAGR